MRVSCVLDRILIDTEEAVEKVRGRKRRSEERRVGKEC